MPTAEATAQAAAQVSAPPPAAERAALIAEATAAAERDQLVPWRGSYQAFPLVRLPAHALVYRAENGRVIAEMGEHARHMGLSLQDLLARQDTAEVQRLLHALLVGHARDEGGPIFQELGRAGIQTEPLLVTAEGVLVNGNRRLAAMRELAATDADRYAGFSQALAAVLPADATPADLDAIEAALQMAPDTKLAYGWINRRLKIRRQSRELGVPVKLMLEAYRIDDPARLDREITELELAEDYLATYCADAGAYSLVADAEPLFVGLAEQLAAVRPEDRSTWKLAGFAMIAGRAGVSGPMDRHFPFAPAKPELLPAVTLNRFAEERGLAAEPPPADRRAPLDPGPRRAVEAVLAARDKAEELARDLYMLMERLRAEFQDERSPGRLLKLIEKVRETMEFLPADALNERQRQRLKGEIAAILARAEALTADAAEAAEAASEPARPHAGPLGFLTGKR